MGQPCQVSRTVQHLPRTLTLQEPYSYLSHHRDLSGLSGHPPPFSGAGETPECGRAWGARGDVCGWLHVCAFGWDLGGPEIVGMPAAAFPLPFGGSWAQRQVQLPAGSPSVGVGWGKQAGTLPGPSLHWVGVGWSPLPSPTGLFAYKRRDFAVCWRLVVSGPVAMGTPGFWRPKLAPRQGKGSGTEGLVPSSASGREWEALGGWEEPLLAGGHMGPWARADQRGAGPVMLWVGREAGRARNLPPRDMLWSLTHTHL